MIESILEIGISNAIISIVIAAIAFLVGRFTSRPHLAHLLWLLVLVKLMMPAVIPVSYNFASQETNVARAVVAPVERSVLKKMSVSGAKVESENTFPGVLEAAQKIGLTYLPVIWCAGILLALVFSVFRVVRFNRLLRSSSDKAPDSIYDMADEIAGRLSLKRLPLINTTRAEISPMVWWVGGKVQVYLPISLVNGMEPAKIRLILAHELAHVKRRDFLVRWLEWSAGVMFWWNPVVWLAQRNLRAHEEICCDALVMSQLNPEPQEYAASLLGAVENFTEPAFRPPAMASEVNSGGYLIRRIHMILSSNNRKTLSGKMQIVLIVAAALVLPLGLTFAQEKEPEIEKRVEQIKKDVDAGKISKDQAKIEITKLKRKLEFGLAKKKLDMAVKEGKISKEAAEQKLEAIKKHRKSRPHRSEELKRAEEKIEAALKEGTISKEEAEGRMMEFKLHHAQFKDRMKLHLAAKKIHSAVKANKISAAEAEEQLSGLKRSIASVSLKMYRQLAAEKLELALKAGKISKQEAQLKMKELKRGLAVSGRADDLKRAQEQLELAVKANEISREEAETKMRALQLRLTETESKSRINDAAKRLELELKAGRMSKMEAAKRLIVLKKQHEIERRMFYLKKTQEKLEAAVKSGKMTEDEAKKKMTELEKKLKSKKDN